MNFTGISLEFRELGAWERGLAFNAVVLKTTIVLKSTGLKGSNGHLPEIPPPRVQRGRGGKSMKARGDGGHQETKAF